MLIAFQIILMILILLFSLASFAEEDKSRTPVYGGLAGVSIVAMALTFMF